MKLRNKKSLSGRPVRIIEVQNNHTFKLNSQVLSSILLDKEIKDKKVVLISITGAFRTGKSFLLNIILNYLKQLSNVKRHSIESQVADSVIDFDWLEGSTKWLQEGFSWCHGDQRDTDGVLMWSEPFLIKTKADDLVVFLLDTQGKNLNLIVRPLPLISIVFVPTNSKTLIHFKFILNG